MQQTIMLLLAIHHTCLALPMAQSECFRSGVNPITSSQNSTFQQSLVNCRDQSCSGALIMVAQTRLR